MEAGIQKHKNARKDTRTKFAKLNGGLASARYASEL
jgi:hypothetical protein